MISQVRVSAPPPDFAAILAAHRAEYAAGLAADLARIATLAHRAADGGAAELADLECAAHTLAGTSGTFGFDLTSALARKLERVASGLRQTADADGFASLRALAAALRNSAGSL